MEKQPCKQPRLLTRAKPHHSEMLWSAEEEEITSAWTMWKGYWKRWHLCSALKEGKERSLRRKGGEHQRLGKQRETKGYHLIMSFFVLILSVFDRIISKPLKQRR